MLYLLESIRIGSRSFGVDGDMVGIENVTGGKLVAVVPFHPPAEVEGYGQPVGGNIPRFGKLPFELQILVVPNETVVNLACNIMGSGVGSKERDQGRWLADGADNEGITVGRLAGTSFCG